MNEIGRQEFERRCLWPISRYFLGVCVEITENIIRVINWEGGGLCRLLPEFSGEKKDIRKNFRQPCSREIRSNF
jgi:hypothetical protein